MRTPEVAAAANTSEIRARVWARKNDVLQDGVGYFWTDEDVQRYLHRNKQVGKPRRGK